MQQGASHLYTPKREGDLKQIPGDLFWLSRPNFFFERPVVFAEKPYLLDPDQICSILKRLKVSMFRLFRPK